MFGHGCDVVDMKMVQVKAVYAWRAAIELLRRDLCELAGFSGLISAISGASRVPEVSR